MQSWVKKSQNTYYLITYNRFWSVLCLFLGGQGKPESLARVERLTGKAIDFVNVDLLNETQLEELFVNKGPFDCVIHFAALKAVGESCQFPLRYYRNNGTGSINLLEVRIDLNL
jgi:UDP-glucose 4-epimerase